MNTELFIKITLSVISILSAVVTYFVIPLIKEKIGDMKYEKFVDFITRSVRAAKQLYTPEEWKKKKDYVLEQAIAWLEMHNIKMTEEQINALIEGIYNEIKESGKPII